jgi:hypothetical protein
MAASQVLGIVSKFSGCLILIRFFVKSWDGERFYMNSDTLSRAFISKIGFFIIFEFIQIDLAFF